MRESREGGRVQRWKESDRENREVERGQESERERARKREQRAEREG